MATKKQDLQDWAVESANFVEAIEEHAAKIGFDLKRDTRVWGLLDFARGYGFQNGVAEEQAALGEKREEYEEAMDWLRERTEELKAHLEKLVAHAPQEVRDKLR